MMEGKMDMMRGLLGSEKYVDTCLFLEFCQMERVERKKSFWRRLVEYLGLLKPKIYLRIYSEQGALPEEIYFLVRLMSVMEGPELKFKHLPFKILTRLEAGHSYTELLVHLQEKPVDGTLILYASPFLQKPREFDLFPEEQVPFIGKIEKA